MSLTVNDLAVRYQDKLAPGNPGEFLRLVNEAEAQLQETAKWHWTKGDVTLTVDDGGYVYIDPDTYTSLLGITLSDSARVIRPREVEFIPDGVGRLTAGELDGGYLVDAGLQSIGIDGTSNGTRRAYKVMSDVEDGDTLDGLAIYAHTSLEFHDTLRCPSSRAMKLAIYACIYEEANDLERAKVFWANAYEALDKHEKTTRGGIRPTPVVRPFGDGISPVTPFM